MEYPAAWDVLAKIRIGRFWIWSALQFRVIPFAIECSISVDIDGNTSAEMERETVNVLRKLRIKRLGKL